MGAHHTEGDELGEDRAHEECGVFGVFAPGDDVARLCYFGLFALQHRGQESAGIAVADGRSIACHKEMGLVAIDLLNPPDFPTIKKYGLVCSMVFNPTVDGLGGIPKAWNRVEHFHADCYVEADQPYGDPNG